MTDRRDERRLCLIGSDDFQAGELGHNTITKGSEIGDIFFKV